MIEYGDPGQCIVDGKPVQSLTASKIARMKRFATSFFFSMKSRREAISVAGGGLGPMSPRPACMNKWPALLTTASVVVGSECKKPSI